MVVEVFFFSSLNTVDDVRGVSESVHTEADPAEGACIVLHL